MKITGIIIAKNEEEMIKDCLLSLKFCDEILVVDNGSNDNTANIAERNGANVLQVATNDFSRLRNEGFKNVKSDWVLYVDADERVASKLAKEIKEAIKNPGEFKAFKICRKNYYFGDKEWPVSEKIVRLFKKANLKGWRGRLHESPKIEGMVGELKGNILHFSHRDLTQMMKKTIDWSDTEAELRFNSKHPKMSWWRFPRVMLSAFFNSYFKQGGYKAGTTGLIESIYQSYSIFITYAKLWEKQIGINDKKNLKTKNKFLWLIIKFWPLIFIFVVWIIFAYPYFLQDKVPFTGTYLVNNFAPWSTYSEFWGPVKNGAMPDVITQIYPWKKFTIDTYKSGAIPLWNPYSFSGTPHLANYQSAVLSPFNLIFFVLPFIDAWSLLVLLQPLLAGTFMLLLMRALKVSKFASLIASISFMFCGFITVWMGYATLGYAILFLPLSVFSIEKYFQTNKYKFLLLLTITIPLSFFSGHFQISIYFLLTVLVYLIYKVISTKDFSSGAKTILFIILGILLAMPQLLPSIEFYSQSLRSTIFRKGEAIPIQYISTFLAPDFLGNPVTRNDWFGHYAEWNGYVGVLPLMLAVYSVITRKKSQSLYLFIFAILILFLAFDTPLLTLLINLHVPAISTSAASRIIVVYSFLFAVLSAFGFDKLIADLKQKKFNNIYLLISLFFIIFLALWSIVFLKVFIPQEKNIIARQNLVLPTLIFVFSSFLILCFRLFPLRNVINKKNIMSFFGLILVSIIAFDLLRFSKKWQAFDPRDLVFPSLPTTSKFIQLSGYDRVLGNLGAESLVYYRMPSIEGYDALNIKRYSELISSVDDGIIKESVSSVVQFPRDAKYTEKTINLLGIKYIIHKKSDDNVSWTFPYWLYQEGTFTLVYEDDNYRVFQNNNAYSRVFLISKYKVINNRHEIISTMLSDKFDLRKEVVLEEDPRIDQGEISGKVNILKYYPNEIDIRVNSSADSLLFISENFYPGWKAYVNKKQVNIFRADYTFRAIIIPKGTHMVKFEYQPESFKNGLYFFEFGVVVLAGSFFLRRRLL